MKLFHSKVSVFIAGLFSLLLCVSAQAQTEETTEVTTTSTSTPQGDGTTTVETTRHTIVTPVPAPKETIAAPSGYVTCLNVDAGWVNDIWVPTHRVCQYNNSKLGSVWIEGYWGCNKATSEGVCTNWEWKSGHWEKKLGTY